MDDRRRSGHPRTKADHQDWQIRGIQREAAIETARSVRDSGLQIAMVTEVDEFGFVRLEPFNDMAKLEGPWFAVLNHVTPQPGENVVYGYLKGSPVVLGILPNEDSTPWRAPRTGLPDNFFIEEFDQGSVASPGAAPWTHSGTANNPSMDAGSLDHPGWFMMSLNNASPANITLRSTGFALLPNALSELEFMFRLASTITNNRMRVGLSVDDAGATNALMIDWNSGSGPNFMLRTFVGGVDTEFGDTGIPAIAQTWYKANLKRTALNEWAALVTNVQDPYDPIEGEIVVATGIPTTPMAAWARHSASAAEGNRHVPMDYIWWSYLGLERGGR